MSPFLAFLIAAGLALSESVQLEVVKLIGLTVTTVASSFAAWLAFKNRNLLDTRRKEVREDVDTGAVVVVEERRSGNGTDGTQGTETRRREDA